MYIGKIAQKTGLSIKAIRLYEQMGLIPTPKRLGRYRVYQDSDVDLLLLIKEAKTLGFTLSQLQSSFTFKKGQLDWEGVTQLLTEHKRKIYREIALLNDQIARIDDCLGQIESCPEMS